MQNRGSENPAFGAGILFGRKYAYFRQTTNGVDYQMCKPESEHWTLALIPSKEI